MAYIAEQVAAGVWTDKTKQEWESILGRYGDYCGIHARSPYTTHTARDYKAEVLIPRLDPRTVNKHITRLSTFFSWAKRHDYVQDRVFEGLAVKRPRAKASDARSAYSQQDVTALLDSLDPNKDTRHWLPLLGLYTGARINELAQLALSDIRVVDGIDVLDINEDGPNRRLKTAQSKRLVPVHSELIERGFLDYVQTLRADGAQRVFPQFPHGRDGYGQAASRWFQRHRNNHALQPVFHALRHTVATRLREGGVPEDVAAELLGHSYGASMSFGLYAKASSVGKLKGALEKLSFPQQPR